MKKVYTIENLDCANCAAKIEAKFNDHPAVEEAVITFATRQLRLTAEDPDALLPELTKIARTVEGEVIIYPREEVHSEVHHPEHHHEHRHECGCGHHHGEGHECGCGHSMTMTTSAIAGITMTGPLMDTTMATARKRTASRC